MEEKKGQVKPMCDPRLYNYTKDRKKGDKCSHFRGSLQPKVVKLSLIILTCMWQVQIFNFLEESSCPFVLHLRGIQQRRGQNFAIF